MKGIGMGKKAKCDWADAADRLTVDERESLRRHFESVALHAAELAAYLDMRAGGGCGDQGHKCAVKSANRVGRLLWVKGFGYNGYPVWTIYS